MQPIAGSMSNITCRLTAKDGDQLRVIQFDYDRIYTFNEFQKALGRV